MKPHPVSIVEHVSLDDVKLGTTSQLKSFSSLKQMKLLLFAIVVESANVRPVLLLAIMLLVSTGVYARPRCWKG